MSDRPAAVCPTDAARAFSGSDSGVDEGSGGGSGGRSRNHARRDIFVASDMMNLSLLFNLWWLKKLRRSGQRYMVELR